MFTIKPLLTSIVLAVSISACAIAPSNNTTTRFVTDTHAAPVAFQALRVEGQTIKGQIHLTGREPVRFGHVDYAVLDVNGKTREQGWVEHSAAIRFRNTHRPALFSIDLQRPLVTNEKILLTYHLGEH